MSPNLPIHPPAQRRILRQRFCPLTRVGAPKGRSHCAQGLSHAAWPDARSALGLCLSPSSPLEPRSRAWGQLQTVLLTFPLLVKFLSTFSRLTESIWPLGQISKWGAQVPGPRESPKPQAAPRGSRVALSAMQLTGGVFS